MSLDQSDVQYITNQIRKLEGTIENLRVDVVDNNRGLIKRVGALEDFDTAITRELEFLKNHLPSTPSNWMIILLVGMIMGVPSLIFVFANYFLH